MRQGVLENVGSLSVYIIIIAQIPDKLPVNFSAGTLRAITLKIIVTERAAVQGLLHVRRRHASDVRRLSSNATIINPAEDVCGEIRSVNGPREMTLLRARRLM
jgi:hypothetical protein